MWSILMVSVMETFHDNMPLNKRSIHDTLYPTPPYKIIHDFLYEDASSARSVTG